MDKVNRGVIYMDPYGNQTAPRNCTVKIRGNKTGVIFLKQRWRGTTSGPCLKGRTVSSETHYESCQEQREYFDKEIEIILETRDTAQPGFTIDFMGEIFLNIVSNFQTFSAWITFIITF